MAGNDNDTQWDLERAFFEEGEHLGDDAPAPNASPAPPRARVAEPRNAAAPSRGSDALPDADETERLPRARAADVADEFTAEATERIVRSAPPARAPGSAASAKAPERTHIAAFTLPLEDTPSVQETEFFRGDPGAPVVPASSLEPSGEWPLAPNSAHVPEGAPRELARLIHNPRSTTQEFVAVLESDALLADRVMRSAATVPHGVSAPKNLEQAIMRIGLEGLREAAGLESAETGATPPSAGEGQNAAGLPLVDPPAALEPTSTDGEAQVDTGAVGLSAPESAGEVAERTLLREAVAEPAPGAPEGLRQADVGPASQMQDLRAVEAAAGEGVEGGEATAASAALVSEGLSTSEVPEHAPQPDIADREAPLAGATDDREALAAREAIASEAEGSAPVVPLSTLPSHQEETPPEPSPSAIVEEQRAAHAVPAAVAASGDEPLAHRETLSAPSTTHRDAAAPALPRAERLPEAPAPFGTAQAGAAAPAAPEVAAQWQARIDELVTEARVQEGSAAAPLWFEAGRIYEAELGDLRQAAGHYQQAHQCDPSFLPVVHAARRLFAQLGKWPMVVVLLDEELKHRSAARAPLLVEKGRIFETRLERIDLAESHYLQALDEEPGYAPALDALRRILGARGEWGAFARVLENAVASEARVEQQVALWLELGRLHDAYLHDDAQAEACFRQALALAPGRRTVLEALRRLYARLGRSEGLLEVLWELAQQIDAPAEAVQLLLERAVLQSSRGDERGATETLEAARARVPGDLLVLSELARLYERAGDGACLVDVLKSQIAVTQDRSERVALHAEAAHLCEEALRDPEQAIVHYRACVDEDPTYQPALSGLGKLYARAGAWPELVGVFEVQIATAPDDEARIPLLFKLAELRASKLDDHDGAIAHLVEVLEIAPGYVPALKLVATYYTQSGRWEDLLRMHEAELADTDDHDQAIFILDRMAQLAEQQLQDPTRAIDAYQRMLQRIPNYLPALRNLGRLYAMTERWQELIDVNLRESQVISHPSQVVALMFRNGEIYAEKLGDAASGASCFRQALFLMPNYLPALKALGSMYARAGQWQPLMEMHRQEAEVARTTAQQAQLLCHVADIQAQKLYDLDGAAETFRHVLTIVPGYHPAIRALARIAHQTGDFASMAEVYRAELELMRDPTERGLMRCRIAELCERYLERTPDAVEVLEDAISESPDLLVAHEHLVSLLARTGDASAEVAARQRMHPHLLDDTARVANLHALGELFAHRLEDSERALQAFEALLVLAPNDAAALRAAIQSALRLRDHRAAIRHAEALASLESDAAEVASLYLQIAAWREGHLDPPEDALPSYLQALAYDPQDPTALRSVERAYVERQAWEGLFQLYQLELQSVPQTAQRADLRVRMGDLAERKLGRIDLAVSQYEAALLEQPSQILAMSRLKELYAQLGRAEDQLRMLALEATVSKDPARSVATLLEVARLQRERFRNPESALHSLYKVLEKDPLHDAAYQEAESLLTELQRADELATLVVARAEQLAEPQAQVDLLQRVAEALDAQLGQPNLARALLERALELRPSDVTLLSRVGALHFGAADYESAERVYRRLVDLAADDPRSARAHHHLGIIFVEHRPDAAAAMHHLAATLAFQPDNRDAARRLAHAYVQAGVSGQAQHLLQQLLDTAATPEERQELVLALCDLYERVMAAPARAAVELERFLEQDAAQRAPLAWIERLAVLYEQVGDVDGYLRAAQRYVERVLPSDTLRAAEALARCAQILFETKNDLEGALRNAKQGLELAPDFVELRGLYADLLSRKPNQLALATEEHRKVLRSGNLRVASLHALYQGWAQNRAIDRAYVTAEILEYLGAADAEERKLREKYAGRTHGVEGELDQEARVFSEGELLSWVAHPAQRNAVQEVLLVAAPELAKAIDDDMTPYGVIQRKDILRARSSDPLRELADELAHALGGVSYDIHRTHERDQAVEAHRSSGSVLVVGTLVSYEYAPIEQRFLLGRKLMALRAGAHLLRGVDTAGLELMLNAIGRSIDRAYPVSRETPEVEALARKFSGLWSRATRKQLAEPLERLSGNLHRIDLAGFLAARPLSEARAGLVLCGALEPALRLVARERGVLLPQETEALVSVLERDPTLFDLVNYALSDAYFMARQRLAFAVDR